MSNNVHKNSDSLNLIQNKINNVHIRIVVYVFTRLYRRMKEIYVIMFVIFFVGPKTFPFALV